MNCPAISFGVFVNFVWLCDIPPPLYNIHCCFPVLLENSCGFYCTGLASSSVEIAFHVDMETGMCVFPLMFPEVMSSMLFYSSGINILCPQVTVASKIHIHTIQKIKLQVNGDTTLLIQKESKGFTEFNTAEKRRREKEVLRWKKRRVKWGENNQSRKQICKWNHILKILP